MIRFRLLGPMARYTGYAVGFRGLVRKLAQRGDLLIELRATRGNVPPETEQYLLDLLNSKRTHEELGVIVGFPPFIVQLGTRRRILYSMYEADDLPFEWRSDVEQSHEVWVPTRFCAKVFGNYNPNIKIVPWGIDTDVYKPRHPRTVNEVYTFGAVGVQSPRKGTDVMVKAFDKAFGERGGAQLIIKTRDTRKMPPISNRFIEVIDEDWDEQRLLRFYQDMDCLLEPSRGEGSGMPPLQAAFCGTPALVTNWGGPADFVDGRGIWGVNITGLTRADSIGAKRAHWAEPDVNHLAELMQWAAETKPKVEGDYSRWTLDSQRDHFIAHLTRVWQKL